MSPAIICRDPLACEEGFDPQSRSARLGPPLAPTGTGRGPTQDDPACDETIENRNVDRPSVEQEVPPIPDKKKYDFF